MLDAFGIERAWAIGHSWGGHLALHLLVTHPERLHGVRTHSFPLSSYTASPTHCRLGRRSAPQR